MGEQEIRKDSDAEQLRVFVRKLLEDVRALETMLKDGVLESGHTRIGAEQELFLVDSHCRPAPLALEALEAIDDPHFTTELARFNLEFNLDPLELGPNCLSQMEGDIHHLLGEARRGAQEVGAQAVMVGILPTLQADDLSLDNMTPMPRYYALNDAIQRLRDGEAFEFMIKGVDELTLTHDSVMVEACNTSFQVHFQVSPGDFARLYNIAQAIAAPVLAGAINSPLLFGRRLWRETRIALFQQSVDTRQAKSHLRHQQARVSFGEQWVNDSVLEIFREDIARFRVLLGTELEEDPFDALAAGKAPSLKALRLHNGTVYRWNRPCYGILNGKPHLRIENRVLPSGPSVPDEVANAALWFGLMRAMSEEYHDITKHVEFDIVKENFLAAARQGLDAQFEWIDRPPAPARVLILEDLLPRARKGLRSLGVSPEEADHYMDIIQQRVESQRTGSRWLLRSLASLRREGTSTEHMAGLTEALLRRQEQGDPVHTWDLAQPVEAERQYRKYRQVHDLMTTDLFTVNEDEVLDLVACLMDWKHIRHVPVEDNQHRLVGLVTHRTLLRMIARGKATPGQPMPVREVMQKELVTTSPRTPILEAYHLMRERQIGCLPVVERDRLVGILTERDLMKISGPLLEDFLSHQ